MNNMLFFQKDADETIAINPRHIRFMSLTSATNVEVSYAGDDNAIGTVDITVDSGTGKAVLGAIASALARGRGLITVADGTNSIFLTPDITAVAAVAISA